MTFSTPGDVAALARDLRTLLGEAPRGASGLQGEEAVLDLARDLLRRVLGLEVELG